MKQIKESLYRELLTFIEARKDQSAKKILKEYSDFLGEGCCRTVYKIKIKEYEEPFALKIEWNGPDYKFIKAASGRLIYNTFTNQNKKEVKKWLNSNHKFLPKIYDWDVNDFRWLEMEYLTKTNSMPPNHEIMLLSEELLMHHSEQYSLHHWGKDAKGQYKICDFGI